MRNKENEYDHLIEKVYDHFDRLVEMLMYRGLSMDDALDLTQEVLIKASRKIKQLRDPDKLEAWINKIANRDATRAIKKLAAERERTVSYIIDEKTGEEVDIYETLPHKDNVEDVVCSDESEKELRKLIRSVGKDKSDIFIKHNLEGYGLNEIATARNENQNTIRSTHVRTRKKLQAVVGEAMREEEL